MMINRERKFTFEQQKKNNKIVHFYRTIYYANPKISKISLYLDENFEINAITLDFSTLKILNQFKRNFESSQLLRNKKDSLLEYIFGYPFLYITFANKSKRDFSSFFNLIHT